MNQQKKINKTTINSAFKKNNCFQKKNLITSQNITDIKIAVIQKQPATDKP